MSTIGSLPNISSLFASLTTSSSTSTTQAIILPSIASSTLLDYLTAQAPVAQTSTQTSAAATPTDVGGQPPWNTPQPANSPVRDAQVLSTANFVDVDNATLTTGASATDKLAKDNQKLFALYQGVNNLYYLASMSQRSTMTPGQLVGFNSLFQTGISQVQSFVSSSSFNDFTLQAGQTSSSVTSSVGVPTPSFSYTGATIVGDANVEGALPNVGAGDSFNIAVTKGGTTTNVPIDLSQVQGPLTIDNIDNYVNQQMAAGGFSTRFARVITKGSIDDPTKATYGIQITPAPNETVALSSASATPALYLAGSTGNPSGTISTTNVSGTSSTSTTPSDVQGRLTKLTNLSGSPTGDFVQTVNPSSGTTTAQATAVDSNGNVYIVGNASGNFGNEINQGSQDVYLSKYDSSGNLQWTQMLGSSGTASAYSLAVNPQGGVVVVGSTTSQLTQTAISDGNTGSFAASYDAGGNQNWVTQIPTLADNQAQAVSVDSSGNVYIGGQVTGEIGAGQTSSGGTNAYVAKLSSTGSIEYEQQFGPSGSDQVAATATTSDGGLVVASVQNGQAIVSKYANGDATQTPEWQVNLGNLQNGTLGNLAVSGNQIYLSGTTANGSLNAGGQASVANASTGGTNGFVFNLTDNGASATPNTVSYVGTSGGNTQGNALTVGQDGTVYLAGTTTGTFTGQSRSVSGVNNMYVAALAPGGNIEWTRQYGGADGQSTAQGVAIDPQGASVLDALGLPRGTISLNQPVDLSSVSTLQTGDSFNIDVQGTAVRNTTITIGQGETLQSLVDKINNALLFNGKASITYGASGEQLKIAVNPGVTANLVAGPADSNALARLGIPAGALTAPAKSTAKSSSTATTSSSSSSSSNSSAQQVFGLGLLSNMNISTSTGAGAAHAALGNVLAQIRNIYQKINSPPSSSTTSTAQQSTGPAPAYLQSQLANYNLALSLMGASVSAVA
jgi:hypothetical protein